MEELRPQTPARIGLLDLPEELLLAICEYLDVATLFLLLQANRKLHQTCLPVSLARYQITNPEQHLKITLGQARCEVDVISLLNLSFDLKTVERISCKFVVPIDETDITVVLRSVRRLEGWLGRLNSVETIGLTFANDRCCCCGTTNFKEECLEEWTVAVGELMRAILALPVDMVKLKGGRYLSHLFVFRYAKTTSLKGVTPFEAIKSLFTGRKERKMDPMECAKIPLSVLKGDNWEFKFAKDSNIGPLASLSNPKAQPESKLRILSIQSIMFLMPPLLHWTIATIQYSSLRRLILKDLSINHKCWPALFDLISNASPGLSELVVAKVRQIMPKDFLHFLSRLPRLGGLSLSRDVDSWDSYDLKEFPDLPKVITLHAPSVWIYKLLSSQSRGLERLESLTISYKLKGDGLNHWLQEFGAPSIPALLHAQRRPLTVSVEVILGSSPGWKMFEDFNTAQREGEVNPHVQLVTSMTLIVSQEFAREDMRLWTVLPKWLELFKALRHLSLVGRNSIVDGNAHTAMLEAVAATRLQLLTLDVNGRETLFGGRRAGSSNSAASGSLLSGRTRRS